MDISQNAVSFIIIGLGKVGTAMGYCLKQAGYSIVAVVESSPEVLAQNIKYTGGKSFKYISDLDVEADCYLITTSDDQIASACAALAPILKPGTIVLHMSGAGSLDLLEPGRKKGAFVGSIHPLQTFSDPESAIRNLPGTAYGITVDASLKPWSEKLINSIGGHAFFINEHNRALYHAAACVVSNYFVSLMFMAEEIFSKLGMTGEAARQAFWPLLTGTLRNIESKGSIASLTGPIARGDIGTIEKHLLALQTTLPSMLAVYRELGNTTIEIALRKKSLTVEKAEKIKSLLTKGAQI